MNRHERRKAAATAPSSQVQPLGYAPWTDKAKHPLLMGIAANPHHPGYFDASLHVGGFRSQAEAAAFVERMAAILREEAGADLQRQQ